MGRTFGGFEILWWLCGEYIGLSSSYKQPKYEEYNMDTAMFQNVKYRSALDYISTDEYNKQKVTHSRRFSFGVSSGILSAL